MNYRTDPLLIGMNKDPLLVGTDFSLLDFNRGVTSTSTASTALDDDDNDDDELPKKGKLRWLNANNIDAFSGLLSSVSQVVGATHKPVPAVHNYQNVEDKTQEKEITKTVVIGTVVIVIIIVAALFTLYYNQKKQ